MDSQRIKKEVKELGAHICGIAPVERFRNAPDGFKPTDIFGDCQAVVVFAKRLPVSSLCASSCVPYTHVNGLITQEVDILTIKIALRLEDLGIGAVPIPSDDPYEHWEEDRHYGRGILSLRHAGYLAGLGVLGKNTLLINENFGNMIQLGAVLVDVSLEPDSMIQEEYCEHCTLCLDSCPEGALSGIAVNQKLCRPLSNYRSNKGYILKKCNICRKVCPHSLGLK